VAADERGLREPVAGEVDQPVAGRHEEGDPAAPVGVQPEDERAEHLADAGDQHERRDARAFLAREPAAGAEQEHPRDESDGVLAGVARVRLHGERDADVGKRGEGEAGRGERPHR
jgi:hypothetical protein